MVHRLGEYSLQDALAVCLPYVAACTDVLLLAALLYDPTMRLLLHSAVPDNYRTCWIFGLCFAQDMRQLFFCVGNLVSAWQLQVTAFEVISYSLEEIMESLERR